MTHCCASLSEMCIIIASIPSERRVHVLPEFFVLGHLKGVHWKLRVQKMKCYKFCLTKKELQLLMMICLILQVSVTAFVLLNNVEIERRPSKRVTVIIESIKNGVEVLRITQILRIEVHKDLGVHIDCHLNYNEHIAKTVSTCTYMLSRVNRIYQ